MDELRGPNYIAERGHVQVLSDGQPLILLNPEKRAYASGGQVMTEAGISPGLFGDIYVALGESLGNDARAVRVHIKPFVRWIWLGAALMALWSVGVLSELAQAPDPASLAMPIAPDDADHARYLLAIERQRALETLIYPEAE